MIRRATEADIPAIVGLYRRAHAVSHWPGYADFSDDCMAAFLKNALGNPVAIVLVAERGGIVGAVICVLVVPLYFNAAVLTAQELFWASESPKDAFALVTEAEREAAKAGASMFMLGSQAGPQDDRTRAVYGRRGYAAFSHDFIRRI